MALEAPEMAATTGKAGLYFVGNEQAASRMNGIDRTSQETGRVGKHAIAGKQRIHQQCSRAQAVALQVGNRRLHSAGKPISHVLGITTIAIRRRHGTHIRPQRHALAKGWRTGRHATGDAMVGMGRDNHPLPTAEIARQPQGQIVGLAAGTGKHGLMTRHGQSGQQALGIIDNAFIQVTGMGVEGGGLPGNGRHHLRVAVAHRGDIVVDIQIGLAGGVVQPHPFAAQQMQGLLIEQAICLPQRLLATADQRLLTGRQAGQRARIKGIGHALVWRIHAAPFVWHNCCR